METSYIKKTLLELIVKYNNILLDNLTNPNRDRIGPTTGDLLEIINKLLTQPIDYDLVYTSKWVGYLQGVMVSKGLLFINKETNSVHPVKRKSMEKVMSGSTGDTFFGTSIDKSELEDHKGNEKALRSDVKEFYSVNSSQITELTDVEIFEIASNVDTCPVWPWYLADHAPVSAVKEQVLKFARAVIKSQREKDSK